MGETKRQGCQRGAVPRGTAQQIKDSKKNPAHVNKFSSSSNFVQSGKTVFNSKKNFNFKAKKDVNLSYLYTNADCLMNKRSELDALIEIHDPEVVGIVEVKPKNSRYNIQECEIALPGYDVFHNLDQQGRGIGLYIKQDLRPNLIKLNTQFEESVFVSCESHGKTMILGLVYRSPNSSEANNINLNEAILEVANLKAEHLAIIGDFNFPGIDWQHGGSATGCTLSERHFHWTTKEAFLIQHQLQPTRFRHGQNPTLDDLVFTNRDDILVDIITTSALGKSDHATLIVKLAFTTTTEQKQQRFNYYKANYADMRTFFGAINWENELQGKQVNEAWDTFIARVEEAKHKFVPKTKLGGDKRKKWLDKETLATVRSKHKLYRRWLETRDDQDHQAYVKMRNKVTRKCRKAKIKLEATVAKQAASNPKSFWSFVKAKTCSRTGIADLKRDDGSIAKTDQEKAEVLNDFFQSVFTREPIGDLPMPPHFDYATSLDDFDITQEDVRKLLKGLKTGKAAGLDGISPILLVETADQLALPISNIFRKSLNSGRIPDDWRKACITPIFKKGSRSSPNNYRPVSLTSIICKTMESLIRTKIMDHLQKNNLICQEQHGFTTGRSCVTQLLDTLDCWTEILDHGGSVDAVYMDFRKAFDSVPHRRLMLKMEAHGIQGKIHKWIEDFLANRTQQVNVNGKISQEVPVWSGIPQGSVLGPLLFVVYINDLPQEVNNEVRIFADDTKLFAKSNQKEGRDSLQEDLDRLQTWSSKWLLKFHPEKCCVMRLGYHTEDHTYFMNTADERKDIHPLTQTEAEKDLGVVIDNKLNYKKHVGQATTKANRTLGVIRRSFDHLTDRTFIQLYKTLVRPMVEYGHSVWQPSQKMLQQEVEDVQRRATKLIGKLKDKPYQERLRILKLPSLEHRRRRGDMIDLYKYLSGLYKTIRPCFEPHSGRDTRGNSRKLAKHYTRTELRRSFFSERVVSVWNDLPESVVTAPSLNSFKARLDAHWANHPGLYCPDCYQ